MDKEQDNVQNGEADIEQNIGEPNMPESSAIPTQSDSGACEKRTWVQTVALVLSRVALVISLIVVVFTFISSFTFNRDDKKIFGVRMYVVLTDSMKATHFAAGDLIFVKDVDFDDLKVGDVITFMYPKGEMRGKTITHQIAEATEVNGRKAFKTKGTTTGALDGATVTEEYYKGKYVGKIPVVGRVFNFIKKPLGYVICILLPFGILIGYQAVNCVAAYRDYRGEKTDELKLERERLQREREENERLLEEMRALKASMEKKKDPEE